MVLPSNNNPGDGTSGQGNDGGTAANDGQPGGGGGAGEAGNTDRQSDGGDGVEWLNGTFYAGGGGAGAEGLAYTPSGGDGGGGTGTNARDTYGSSTDGLQILEAELEGYACTEETRSKRWSG